MQSDDEAIINEELVTQITKHLKHHTQRGWKPPFVAICDFQHYEGMVIETEYGSIQFVMEDTGTARKLDDGSTMSEILIMTREVYLEIKSGSDRVEPIQ